MLKFGFRNHKTLCSNVRRILKRGGPETSENSRRTKVGMNIVSLQFSPIFRPKSGEDQKKVFAPIWSDLDQKEKKLF